MGAIDNYKKAAMHIHSLANNDKHWLLSRLEEKDSRIIREHLDALAALSVPKNRKLINTAIESLDEKSEKELYEILNRSVLNNLDSVINIFEREPAWIGACLKLEYPGLVESYISPELSKITLREIEKYTNDSSFKFSVKLKVTIFELVANHLRNNIADSGNKSEALSFDVALKKAV